MSERDSQSPEFSSKKCCHDPLDGNFTMTVEHDARANYVGITCTACGHGVHIPMPELPAETKAPTHEVTAECVEHDCPCQKDMPRSVEGLETYPYREGELHPVKPVLGTPLQISDDALANLIKYESHHNDFCAFVELWERRGALKTLAPQSMSIAKEPQ